MKNFGFIFQQPFLVPYLNLLENILVPIEEPTSADIDRAYWLLEHLGLTELAPKFPNECSGGERVRASIARGLVHRPQYLFVDEPTANLDLATGARVMQVLKTQRERIVPYIATNIFYFWVFLVFVNQPEVPTILTGFMFGVFIASSAALIANIYFKISMHALGVGSLCGLMLIIIFSGFTYPVFLTSMLVFLITGFVGTSRLIVSDHRPFEIYSGVFIAILCQLIAYGIFL